MLVSRERPGIGKAAIAVIIVVVIAVAGAAAYLVGTSSTPPTSPTTTSSTSPPTTSTTAPASTSAAPKQFKIALIGASTADNFFAEFFGSSLQKAAASLSTPDMQITVTQAFSISPAQITSVCQSYANQGYQLIVLYVDYAGNYVQIAQAVPNVQFVDEFATPNGFNASAYNYVNPGSNHYTYNATNMVGWDVNLGGAYYVAGVAAALASKTHKVGYDAAYNIPLLAEWYNDYAAGVHSIDSSIPVYYGLANDWTDATKGAAQADAMIARGADVVATAGDSQSIGAAKEAATKGVFGIGYPTNLNNLSATNILGSVYFNATSLGVAFIHDAVTNNLSGHFYSTDFAHKGNQFIVNPPLVSSGVVSRDMVSKIQQAGQALTSYSVVLKFTYSFPPEPS